MDSNTIKITEALAVCAEITGTEITPIAIKIMVSDLMAYPFPAVMMALQRCRRELNGRLTLAAILDRIDDGWPSADEAFNGIIEGWRDESLTVITTEIARLASNEAHALYVAGDKIGARMAFKACYERLVSIEKSHSTIPNWIVSAGTDKAHLTTTVANAVAAGKLTKAAALVILPAGEKRAEIQTDIALTEEQKRIGRERLAPMLALLDKKCSMIEANNE